MSVKPRINEALDGLNTRTFKDIEIEGKKVYITNYESGIFLRSNREAFFGKAFFRKICLQIYTMDGLEFDREAHPVEEIGVDERGKRIEAIIGALGMENWELISDPKAGSIDLTVLRKREFIEF